MVEEDKKSLILSMGRTNYRPPISAPSPAYANRHARHSVVGCGFTESRGRRFGTGCRQEIVTVSLRALKPRARSKNLFSRIWFRIAMIGSANYFPGRSDPNRPRSLRRLIAGATNPQPATFYLGGKSKEVVLIIISKIAFVIEEKHGSISSLQPCALLPCYSFSTGEIPPTLVRSEVISGLSRRCPPGRYFSIKQYSPIF